MTNPVSAKSGIFLLKPMRFFSKKIMGKLQNKTASYAIKGRKNFS